MGCRGEDVDVGHFVSWSSGEGSIEDDLIRGLFSVSEGEIIWYAGSMRSMMYGTARFSTESLRYGAALWGRGCRSTSGVL